MFHLIWTAPAWKKKKKNHHVENKSLLTALKKKSAWHIDMEFLNMKNKVNVIQLHLSGRLFFVSFSGMFSFFVKKILSSLHFNVMWLWIGNLQKDNDETITGQKKFFLKKKNHSISATKLHGPRCAFWNPLIGTPTSKFWPNQRIHFEKKAVGNSHQIVSHWPTFSKCSSKIHFTWHKLGFERSLWSLPPWHECNSF